MNKKKDGVKWCPFCELEYTADKCPYCDEDSHKGVWTAADKSKQEKKNG